MSISLEKLIQILAEEDILIIAKIFTTPREVKEEFTIEELCTSYEEQSCEKKIEKDEEGISGDQNHEEYPANGSSFEQWIQVSTSLNQFCFCFFNLHFQHLVLHIFIHLRFQFVKLNFNFCLVLLHRWLHWQFHYM